jgi:VWA domain containing CoxE-like protein
MVAYGERIPVPDAPALSGAARRTLFVRIALAAGILGGAALAYLLADRLQARPSSYFAEGATGVVVIDFSTSIDPGKYRRIARVLRTVSETSQPIGLVVYSDTAYEAIPPGTRGDALRPLLRFYEAPEGPPIPGRFNALRGPRNFPGQPPRSPWQETFRGGTRISSGLRVAREMLERDRVRGGSVMLVSDLDDSPFDTNRLADEAIRYRRSGLDVRLVSLNPSREDRELFLRLFGAKSFVDYRELLRNSELEERRTLVGSFPTGLAFVGSALLLLLALTERVNARLRWRRGGAT